MENLTNEVSTRFISTTDTQHNYTFLQGRRLFTDHHLLVSQQLIGCKFEVPSKR
jgi:hypothetical protein